MYIKSNFEEIIFGTCNIWAKRKGLSVVIKFLFPMGCLPLPGAISLIPSQSLNLGAPQMTLQQYLSILPCLPLPWGNLQTHFPSIPWCYLPISSSVYLSFLLLSLSLAEMSSPFQRILRCGHTIWVSVFLPWLGDHQPALQLHSGFCCEPPRLSHGLCRKCSEVSYSISSQGLESFSQFLLSRSSSHRHKGR